MDSKYDSLDFLKDYIKKPHTYPLELEGRIRNIDENEFHILLDKLYSENWENKKEKSINYYLSSEKRITFKEDKFFDTTKTSVIDKKFKCLGKSLKISLSEEMNDELYLNELDDYEFKREKERWSFEHENLRYDLTEVLEKEEKRYEFEIEVIDIEIVDLNFFYSELIKWCDFISKIQEKVNAIIYFGLSDEKLQLIDKIPNYLISKPRDFKKADFTDKNSILRGFYVSIKADGFPYFLVFSKKFGVWLVSLKQGGVNLRLSKLEKEELDETVFIGELLEDDRFLSFDCICYKGDSFVSKKYSSRISKLENITIRNKMKKVLEVQKKETFYLGETSESFFENFQKCYNLKKEVDFKEDGYIFTPENSPFVAEGQSQKDLKKRVISRYLDVCKFKPLEKKTLDFLVKDKELYYFDNFKRRNVKLENVKFSLDFEEDLEGKIVEFSPKIDNENVTLFPERIRIDKDFPNKTQHVLETLEFYKKKDEVTEKTLLGLDTVLMRSFNNLIKRDVIKDLSQTVIDIGAGRGGDLFKYNGNKSIDRVLLIEPNEEFFEELKYRLSNLKKRNDIFFDTLNCKAEETEKIDSKLETFFKKSMKNEKLFINFMISLTFFWSSEENLKQLKRTLESIRMKYKERNGNLPVIITFYTLDGIKMKDFLQKEKKRVLNESITLELTSENQVFVDIKDSKTVKNQIEYLVDFNKLRDILEFKDLEKQEPDTEGYLLSKGEKEYIRLHSKGKLELSGKIDKGVELDRLSIDLKRGVTHLDKILALGDDVLEEMFDGLFRIATLNLDKSSIHSILKLTSENYRNSGIEKRIELAKKIETKDNSNLILISDKFNVGIKVYKGENHKIINKDKFDKFVILNECLDESFEPVVFIHNEEVSYVFDKNSYLI